jgi:UDP-N-acetylmuramate dehydrogenase
MEILCPDGAFRWIGAGEAGFSYRRCAIPAGCIVTRVRMELKAGGADAVMNDLEDLKEHRARTQPWGLPSAGSVFRNPGGDRAGRLIDTAGLKGLRLGGAEVSEIHANFIVNRGKATAGNVKRLIEIVQAEVERKHGVRLEPEIRIVGEF